jgi:hypothetical protein
VFARLAFVTQALPLQCLMRSRANEPADEKATVNLKNRQPNELGPYGSVVAALAPGAELAIQTGKLDKVNVFSYNRFFMDFFYRDFTWVGVTPEPQQMDGLRQERVLVFAFGE